LAGFAKALKIKYSDIEVGLDFDPEPGLADNGDLEQDLAALLETVGAAAQQAETACGVSCPAISGSDAPHTVTSPDASR
jgi:hypothetical protein